MRVIFQASLLCFTLVLLQGCANSGSSDTSQTMHNNNIATNQSATGVPTNNYLYRSPSYQISHMSAVRAGR